MTDRYDPLPDLAALLAASVYEDAIPPAVRLSSKLRIRPESGAKLIEARICEALALLMTERAGEMRAEADDHFPATWAGGHALIVEFGDEEMTARCQCGVPLGTGTPATSLETFAQPWETHAMTAGR